MFQALYMLIIRRLIALMQHLVSSSQSVAVRCTGFTEDCSGRIVK